jgi:Tfp pilus assembly protein PilP
MKYRKSTVSILLFLCFIVWGTIGWKVYSNLKDSSLPVLQVAKPVIAEKKDSVYFLLNYRDPFLGDFLMEDEVSTEAPQEQNFETPEQQMGYEEDIIPNFQYKGTMRIGKVSQAIVAHQDESILLSVQDKIGEFVVLQISEKVLTVSRAGKKYQLNLE